MAKEIQDVPETDGWDSSEMKVDGEVSLNLGT
jgi:hypothetical protein